MKRTLAGAAVLFGSILALVYWSRSEAADSASSEPRNTDVLRTSASSTYAEDSRRLALRQWSVTPEEYDRYEVLMSGIRGSFSNPNISPLEVLGIHARTPQERRKYADRLVRVLYEDTERVLAFEREVQAAWKRLGKPMFEPGAEPSIRKNGRALVPGPDLGRALAGNRLAVFVASEGCPQCLSQVRMLAGRADDLPGLDLYVTDTSDAGAIRRFAREAGVSPEAVAAKRITLNRGAALFALYEGDHTLPALFVRIDDRLVPLDAADTLPPRAQAALKNEGGPQ